MSQFYTRYVPPVAEHVNIPTQSITEKRKREDQPRSEKKSKKPRLDDDGEHEPFKNDTPPELHGLVPIPQPEESAVPLARPTYSVLPSWQEQALRPSPDAKATFKSLGVTGTLLETLKRNGFHDAFPVQTAVLPLLIDGEKRHEGDVCVSAATGSGKTLSYVLPMISNLQGLSQTKLRGVIVVPTRELVKQVRELCELCATSTSLKIATAVGTKILKDEQDMLIAEETVYDLKQYQADQKSTVDWSKISLAKVVSQAHEENPLHNVGFVKRHRSKVDILITTPGRLVDHLKSTPGFTLDDVRWLVIDEADRLLNESYQEWVGVVVPALSSRVATKDRDELLESLAMLPPRRKVTKVLLSATMTRDISKLNALGLNDPKLVVLGSNTTLSTDVTRKRDGTPPVDSIGDINQNGILHLPSELKENVLSVPDGAEKPLYLMELLLQISTEAKDSGQRQATAGADSHDDVPSSDSSSDTSDSLSDSTDPTSSEEDESTSAESSSPMRKAEQESLMFPVKSPAGEEGRYQPRALIFVRSTASATRLARLLSLLRPSLSSKISTLTRSTASSASSRRALSSFRKSTISILIATDRASRGLDVPGLDHVISYDAPSSALTYIHRVGRTARAGTLGHAWSLIEHREAAWFWREIGGKGDQTRRSLDPDRVLIDRRSKIRRVNLELEDEKLRKNYEEALMQLGTEARSL